MNENVWKSEFEHTYAHSCTYADEQRVSPSPRASCKSMNSGFVEEQLAHGSIAHNPCVHTHTHAHIYAEHPQLNRTKCVQCTHIVHVDKNSSPFVERITHNMVSCMFISDKWISSRAQTPAKSLFVVLCFVLFLFAILCIHTLDWIGYTYKCEWMEIPSALCFIPCAFAIPFQFELNNLYIHIFRW